MVLALVAKQPSYASCKSNFDDKLNAKYRTCLCLSTVPSRGPPFNYSDLVTRSPHALYTLALQHIVT